MLKRIIIILYLSIFLIGCSHEANLPTSEDIILLQAIKNNDLDLVESVYGSKGYSRDKLIIINSKNDNSNYTPLMIAIMYGKDEIVEKMLTYSLDVNRVNSNGTSGLFLAAVMGNDRIVTQLLKAKADVNLINNDSSSPLIAATKNGHLNTVKLLLDYGADGEHKMGTLTAKEIALYLASQEKDSKKKSDYIAIHNLLSENLKYIKEVSGEY